MGKLPFVSTVILLALLALLVGGCGSSAPQQTPEFEAQPTSRFASGEALAIVQTWLGQRTYSYTSCTQLRTTLLVCPDEAKQQRVGNCLEYVNGRGADWSESLQPDGVLRVTAIARWSVSRGIYVWEVYEQSQSVRTVKAPGTRNPCR